MWRRVLEQATHPFHVRRRLPGRFKAARIYVSTEGGLKYLRPSLSRVDSTLLELVSELIKPGDVVWDIGANMGLFSFAAAVAAGGRGSVLAVEPDVLLAAMLHRSAAANKGIAPVDILAVAVADRLDVGRFNIAMRSRAANHLDGFGYAEKYGVRASCLVPMVTLNWLAKRFPLPDVLKIDVEAAEAKVLAGASQVLQAGPKIICEVSSGNAPVVRDLLSSHGYEIYDGSQPSEKRIAVDFPPWNTVAIVPTPDLVRTAFDPSN